MAMTRGQSIFGYKTVKGPLHKLPALLKLFMLLPLSVFCMALPSIWLAAGILAAVIAAFIFGFTLREQLTDLKPAVLYAALMYALSVFSNIFEDWGRLTAAIFLPRPDFLRITLRLALIIQLSTLLFRTTSAIEIREGLCSINRKIGENISLFLCFIPEIFRTWTSINLAWKARGGKNGVLKIKTTVFVLISLSMEKAAVKAMALESRKSGV